MSQATHRLSRFAATVVGVSLAASVAIAAAPGAPRAHAGTASLQPSLSRFDSRLLADMNRARARHGLAGLQVTAGTTDVAHRWSCHLAASRDLYHNGSLASQLASHGSRLWTSYAENVGYVRRHAGADRLFKAYMNSPEHRANILDPSSRFIGVWTKKGAGKRWNTIDFVGSRSTSYNTDYGIARSSC